MVARKRSADAAELTHTTSPRSKNIRTDIAGSENEAAVYLSDDGKLQHVQPYWFDFRCHVKGRWIGRAAVDVCAAEFAAFPKEHYEEAAKNGGLIVVSRDDPEGQNTSAIDRVLTNNDLLIHRTVITEHPIPAAELKVVHEDDRVIAVDKPSGWPVHPTGKYRINSVVRILYRQRADQANASASYTTAKSHHSQAVDASSAKYVSNKEFKAAAGPNPLSFLPMHRLDRPTSGLLLIAKDNKSATEAQKLLAAGDETVMKIYLARVNGRLHKRIRIESDIFCVNPRLSKFGVENVVISVSTGSVEEYTATTQRDKTTLQGAAGKWSATEIEPMLVSDTESIVVCRPLTGRTHQIRLHLQALGHSIVNDECYGGAWDPEHPFAYPRIVNTDDPHARADGHMSGIFLHAWKYRIPGFADVQTDLPEWAKKL